MKKPDNTLKSLCEVISKLNTPSDVENFLIDLCTPSELASMADRWMVAKLLDRDMPYRKIYEVTGVSTATITRVARSLTQGEEGYKVALLKTRGINNDRP